MEPGDEQILSQRRHVDVQQAYEKVFIITHDLGNINQTTMVSHISENNIYQKI